ncbi:MAG: ABC transporter ATP-binding protein [Betaproteobacteria bacterium]|nr:ABC transporter ATP-binding protein [Betaproteobacteria bacterium]
MNARLDKPLVTVEDLTVKFVSREATVHAVNGVSFTLDKGEVLGILGESGSGKSVTLRALMRLLPSGKTQLSGRVEIAGRDVMAMDAHTLSGLRGPVAAMIFQEPMTALDPVFTVGRQIVEAIVQHDGVSHAAARARALELLDMVQIPSAARRFDAYPHQLSGGLRQRAMMAIALSCRPALLLADEPTTALDATVQIQILLLLRTLQKELGMAMIFVTHDLGVAVEVSHQVAVMYAGRFVETGPVTEVARRPRHPYTEGLMGSTVHEVPKGMRLRPIAGSPPNLAALPPGCSFAPRCRYAAARCVEAVPPQVSVNTQAKYVHSTRCLFPERVGSATQEVSTV